MNDGLSTQKKLHGRRKTYWDYTAGSVYERPVYVKISVYEGHLAGFMKVPYEKI